VSHSLPTALAEGYITPAAKIVVELVDRDMPMVVIHWPETATLVSPKRYDEIASRAMRLLANASTELAARSGRMRTEPRQVDDESDE
jgi:hypothetical protein